MTQLRSSRIKRLLAEGKFPTVMKFNLTDPRITELAGVCGFDAAWFCNEHVPTDWLTLEHAVRAARLHDMDSLVRVSKGGYSDYVRPLEAGATGIIVPHVESAGEAEKIVAMTRFYPLGQRALDGGNTDGLYCAVPQDEYLENSNTEKLIVLQIESPEGLAQVDEIAAVPGFDGFLFGPGDFSHRIGKAGQLTAPEVTAARQHVAKVARDHGKFAMTSGLFVPFGQLVSEGVNVFNLGSDVGALQTFFRERLQSLQGNIAALPANLKNTSPYA